MRIAVLGATGQTGRRVVEQAVTRGHQVSALARDPRALGVQAGGVTWFRADAFDLNSLITALEGSDLVISTVGIGTSRAPTELYSRGTANQLAAMAVHGIGKLAVVSAAPVGPRNTQPFLQQHLIMPVLDRIFGAIYADMRRMEALLSRSDIDWIALRPPRLLDKPGTGAYRLGETPLPKARRLTYSDLAAALLDSVARGDLDRRALYVAN
jgi:uncharacterized protein YbjT (DUF2867 family)